MFMKFTIKTQNSKMAFDLRPDEVESLVWTAFQYAAGNQQYQEEPEPRLEAQPEEGCEEYVQDEEYMEGGTAWPRGETADLGSMEATEEPALAEKNGILEEPIQGNGERGFDSGFDDAMGQESSEELPQNPAQEEPEQMPSEPQAMGAARPWRYKGFLLIKCQHCGMLKGFCAKTPIDTYICDCGGKTPIQNMVHATAVCECGKTWTYRTNARDQTLEINCIQCGSPIDLTWNARKVMYVTLRDRD